MNLIQLCGRALLFTVKVTVLFLLYLFTSTVN